jgi:predicted nucleotidyltransferase
MSAQIQTLLAEIEAQRGIEILYACESGSRAWGFASPDSDYDIRFLYRRPIVESYGIEEHADTIEIPIENDLDPGGWELRKALGLLRKSNGALIEWLHSPITYRVHECFLTELRLLAQTHLSRKGLANHYRGMAQRTYRVRLEVPEPTAKAYLYGLRALLAAQHVLKFGSPPPVPFEELLPLCPPEVRTAIEGLLLWKADALESASPGRSPVIDDFLAETLPSIASTLDDMEDDPQPVAPFEQCLHRWTIWPTPPVQPTMRQADFTIARIREPDLLLFECITGSRSFGTHNDRSDLDLKGIFVAPDSFLAGLESIEQVNDSKHDETYYEIRRFVSLLTTNNPNIIELLFTPADCIRFKHPAFELLRPELFLSKLCRQSFGNYAMGQIRKARGLNKKIVNPQPEQRHHLRHFCHVLEGQGSVPLEDWLAREELEEAHCALVAVHHAPDTYALFHDPGEGSGYRGIFTRKDDSALICSSVPREARPIAWIRCNLDAFKAHCKSHREYWQWVEERNEDRYQTNTSHGRGYDSKNLMHTLRLLEQGLEIAREGRITLPRPNADWLKTVKEGAYDYEDLLNIAETKHLEMEAAFEASPLPEAPSFATANALLIEIRQAFRSQPRQGSPGGLVSAAP